MACKKCHPEDQISKSEVHSKYSEDNSPVCTDCHGSHSVAAVKGGKILKDERQYCLGCHKHQMHMDFRNKEKMSLMVDVSQLESSVHNKLTCSDCHYGFSAEEHPKRDFRTKRDFSIASSEICRRCHFDKHIKILDSDCYSRLSHGNLNAPVCTDCHGAHSISRFGKERTLIAQRCRKCHPEIYDTYANSIHGRALFDQQNEDVPVCINCHKAHDINNPLTLDYRERIPEMCSNCHSNKAVMAKYGLSTNVVKTYLSDFHGITLDFYKKQRETLQKPGRQIAVCTDCHGTHNISSTIGTDANLLRANLIKRCQKCHQSATENFPDAWLSHYEPNLKKAPIVFIVNLLYKIFMPVMIIGLLLQILLHIWRYAVNR